MSAPDRNRATRARLSVAIQGFRPREIRYIREIRLLRDEVKSLTSETRTLTDENQDFKRRIEELEAKVRP